MADWPDVSELAQVLDLQNIGDWETTLDRVLQSAINRVKADVGGWDESTDVPDEQLAQAALRMAELLSLRPESAIAASNDPTYSRLMVGHRRRFAIS